MKESINTEKAMEIARELHIIVPQKFAVRVVHNQKLARQILPKWGRKKIVKIKDGKKVVYWITLCGQFSSDFFLQAGYDMEPILRGRYLWDINTTGQYANALESVEKGHLVEVTAEQAFYLPVIARPVLCLSPKTMVVDGKPYNHAGITWAVWWEEYDEDKGPKIAQQGWHSLVNKYISHRYAWGKHWTNPAVKYFLPDLKG